jgi:hypothetical protein
MMEFPLRVEAGEEIEVALHDVPLRFRVEYRHLFPDAAALEHYAFDAWLDRYEGLRFIGGKTYEDWRAEQYQKD